MIVNMMAAKAASWNLPLAAVFLLSMLITATSAVSTTPHEAIAAPDGNGVKNYTASPLVCALHNLPHFNLQFQSINATSGNYDPTSWDYLQTLAVLAGSAALIGVVMWLGLWLASCCLVCCCRRHRDSSRGSRVSGNGGGCRRTFLGIWAFLVVGGVAMGCFYNAALSDAINTALDDARDAKETYDNDISTVSTLAYVHLPPLLGPFFPFFCKNKKKSMMHANGAKMV